MLRTRAALRCRTRAALVLRVAHVATRGAVPWSSCSLRARLSEQSIDELRGFEALQRAVVIHARKREHVIQICFVVDEVAEVTRKALDVRDLLVARCSHHV